MENLAKILIFFILSCSFDYDKYINAELDNFNSGLEIKTINFVEVDNFNEVNKVEALEGRYYFFDKSYVFRGVNVYSNFDRNSKLNAQIDIIKVFESKDYMKMFNEIKFNISYEGNNIFLTSNRLDFYRDTSLIKSPLNTHVYLNFDGNIIKGKNFEYSLESNIFKYNSGIVGTLE